MNTIFKIIFIALLFLSGSGVSSASESKAVVFVSIAPMKFFVEKISGGKVDCQVMVAPGASPATYEPTPRQLALLAKAKAFFAIGVPFENAFLPKLHKLYPKLNIVETQHGITLIDMAEHHHHEDEHHDKDEHHHKAHGHEDKEHHDKHEHHEEANKHEDHHAHEHGGKDPHIWLDPTLAKIIANNIGATLIKIAPEQKATFSANLKSLERELDKLDTEIAGILKPVKGKTLMVFHPAWGYLAKRYGLIQEAVEIEGKSPSAKELTKLIAEAKEDDIKTIFVQEQFSMKAAKAIAHAINGNVSQINPLAENYADNLISIAKTIRKGLE